MNKIRFYNAFIVVFFACYMSVEAFGQNLTNQTPNKLEFEMAAENIAIDLAQQLNISDAKNVGVIHFTDLNNSVTNDGREAAESISIYLFRNAKGFSVVDRSSLNVLVEENRKGRDGILNDETVAALGDALGMDTVIVVTISKVGEMRRIQARAISVSSSVLVAAAMPQRFIAREDGDLKIDSRINNGIDDKNSSNASPISESSNFLDQAPQEILVLSPDEAIRLRGEKVYRKCKACHKLGEGAVHGVGPRLNGIVGSKVGNAKDFKYSKAFIKHNEDGAVWSESALRTFLRRPKKAIKGTKMSFAGLSGDEDIDAIIAYLKIYPK